MPDSYGKRQRDAVKARKAAAREERRIARRQRRADGSAGPDEGFTEGTPAGEDADEFAAADDSMPEEVVDLRDPTAIERDMQPAELEKEGS